MELVLPHIRFKKSYIAAQRELRQEGAAVDIDFEELKDFTRYVDKKRAQSEGRRLPKGFVPCTEYWMAEGDHFLGRVVLRHFLNDALKIFGGHIGYEVRPTERRKGYATKALALTLIEAKKRGLEKVLITCDDTNEASIKVIEGNGGLLVATVAVRGRQVLTRHYEILLK